MENDTDLILGALNDNKEIVTKQLDSIVLKIDDHADRLARVETKVDDLNNIKKTVRNSLIRWLIPYIAAAAGVGYLASLLNGG